MKKKMIIKLSSLLIYIFALCIHLYDMIKHNRLRMLCRSIGSSTTLAISWIFIVLTILIIIYQNKNLNKKVLYVIFLCYIFLTISSTLDYKNRIKTRKNFWKKIHYILSVQMLISLVYGVYTIKSEYFPFVFFILILFLVCHTTKDFIIKDKISIIFELLLIYTTIFLILLKNTKDLNIMCVEN